MSFRVAQETLEALEWPQIVALLREHCRSAQARQALLLRAGAGGATNGRGDPGRESLQPSSGIGEGAPASAPTAPALFEQSLAGVQERLAETSEAVAQLRAGQLPPLASTPSLGNTLFRAEKGGALELQQLVDVRATLQILHALARHLAARAAEAPRLAAVAATIEPQRELEQAIDACIDEGGELRDGASPVLAAARRDVVRLSHDLQRRLARYLQSSDVSPHLSDSYYTVRHERYVLPVKADARGRVRGIVHDASRSGTTLFIEPEAVVELNNQLKQAELEVVRETLRILRQLSSRVGQSAPSVQASLEALVTIDLAYARGRLSLQMDASAPEVRDEGVLDLPQLRHPLIAPADCVANDIGLGRDFSVLLLSGPNAGGKTVSMKAVALAGLMTRAGLHVPCAAGARVDLVDHVIADIGDHQDIGESLSTFSAHMTNLADIVASAGRRSLVVLDEIGVGTDPGEGAALAQAILERLAESGARVIATTHYNLLKEMAEVDPRFHNASVDFDPATLLPSYRLRMGVPGISSAAAVAARMGMPSTVLDRAEALLQREDRQLDRMLSELAASRATLESERQQAARLRAESESARDEYRARLERLQQRRDELFRTMREDLDRAFKQAHGEVAGVIRELQRGPTPQRAAAARDELIALESHALQAEREAGIRRDELRPAGLTPVDWRRIAPGDPVLIEGGREGVLLELPDRRGRVSLRVGGARLVLPSERVGRGAAPECSRRESPRVRVVHAGAPPPELGGGTHECDLRGSRVDEALDRLAASLDRAAAQGCERLRIIHGFGTGALRRAVREHLDGSPLVSGSAAAEQEEGGDGVTLAELL